MRIYRADFQLQGVLIFSSEIRPMVSAGSSMGSYISPSPYVHNYPVMYGLLGKSAEAYFVFPSLHYLDYPERKGRSPTKQGLKYTSIQGLLSDFVSGKGKFYAFPLVPVKLSISSFLMSSESWSYVLPVRMPTKNVFPRLTSYSAFMPGSAFTTYVVATSGEALPRWIRIGKKRWGIFSVNYEEVKVEKVERKKNEMTSVPVNLKDTTEHFKQPVKSFSKVLETPNLEEGAIGWAVMEECDVIHGAVGNRKLTLCLPLPEAVLNSIKA